MPGSVELASFEEAKDYAAENGGKYYVLAPETLAQIEQVEAAEAAGGYEGGMSCASGDGGYSAEGSGGANASSANETVEPDFYFWRAGAFFDGAIEMALTFRDLLLGLRGHPGAPILLVPKRELDNWLNGPSPDGT